MPPTNMSATARQAGPIDVKGVRPTRVRHTVLWLTVLAYMVTYMDRAVISSAMPVIQKEFGFSIITAGWILMSFRIGYALFQLPGGWLGDRIGPRRALTLIVTWWSLFTSATALCLECRLDDRSPVSVRSGRSGRVSHRDAIAFEMDASVRARLCARRHACRIASGGGIHAAHRGVADGAVRMACSILHLRLRGYFVGGCLVLVLPGYSRASTGASTRRNCELIHSHIGERSRTSTKPFPGKPSFLRGLCG